MANPVEEFEDGVSHSLSLSPGHIGDACEQGKAEQRF